MTTEYLATPRASTTAFLPAPVALVAATIKTALQIATPSTTDIVVIGWGVSFDGPAGGTQVPVICSLVDDPTAATAGTALTPETWGNALAPTSLCVGGTALTAYNCTTETTLTGPRYLDSQEVSPQAGYAVYWPDGRQPKVGVSRFLRVRCTAPAGVNVIPWVLWAEPAV
jgi:hypothetical protein